MENSFCTISLHKSNIFFLGKFIFYCISNGCSKYLNPQKYKENSQRYPLFHLSWVAYESSILVF